MFIQLVIGNHPGVSLRSKNAVASESKNLRLNMT